MSNKPKLPPLPLHQRQPGKKDALGHCKTALRSIPTPPEMAVEDMSDDVRDLVIGSPIPQHSLDEEEEGDGERKEGKVKEGKELTSRDSQPQSPSDFPSIRVDKSEGRLKGRKAMYATLAETDFTAIGSSESADDDYKIQDKQRLSPSPKLYRKKDVNHVKYFKISDDCNAADVCTESVSTMHLDLNLNTSPEKIGLGFSDAGNTRLSPILSPSSISPAHSPRSSPGSSPRLPRSKERIRISTSPVQPRKGQKNSEVVKKKY